MRKQVEVGALVGLTLSKIVNNEDDIDFHTIDGRTFRMYHDQECCERVTLEETIGSFDDLIGTPILLAEQREGEGDPLDTWDECYEWTFYEFRTIKGSVTLRWYGASNGYYSTSVSVYED
jgi:hypothetical protein